jgi:hypothetical protein
MSTTKPSRPAEPEVLIEHGPGVEIERFAIRRHLVETRGVEGSLVLHHHGTPAIEVRRVVHAGQQRVEQALAAPGQWSDELDGAPFELVGPGLLRCRWGDQEVEIRLTAASNATTLVLVHRGVDTEDQAEAWSRALDALKGFLEA